MSSTFSTFLLFFLFRCTSYTFFFLLFFCFFWGYLFLLQLFCETCFLSMRFAFFAAPFSSNPLYNSAPLCYNQTMKSNYKIPPVSTNDPFAMLRYFGCNAEENQGEKKNREGDSSSLQAYFLRRKLFYSIRVFDSTRLPRIACPLTNNPNSLIVISFPGPPSFGSQSFSFDPESLLSAISDSKSKTNKNLRLSELLRLQRLNSAEALTSSPFLDFVLDNFSISPSTINRLYNHKRGYLKLVLQPSVTKFNKNINAK